jgi:hypothetical protein
VSIAQRLVADGETVFDVPARLSARVRALGGGSGRKTDDTDAFAVAVAGLRASQLTPVRLDDTVTVLRLLSDRRQELVEQRIATVNRLHRLLVELIPGGAGPALTAAKAKTVLASVRPRTLVERARKDLARDHLRDLVAVDQRLAAMRTKITQILAASPTSLTQVRDIGQSWPPGSSVRSATCAASPAATTSPATPAPHPSTCPPATTTGTGSTAAATAASTTPCTLRRSARSVSPATARTTTGSSGSRQDTPRSRPLPQTTPIRRHLPPARGRPGTASSRPGRTLGDDCSIERG